MFKKLQRRGFWIVEYVLISVLVGVVVIIVLSILGPAIGNTINWITNLPTPVGQ